MGGVNAQWQVLREADSLVAIRFDFAGRLRFVCRNVRRVCVNLFRGVTNLVGVWLRRIDRCPCVGPSFARLASSRSRSRLAGGNVAKSRRKRRGRAYRAVKCLPLFRFGSAVSDIDAAFLAVPKHDLRTGGSAPNQK